MVIIDFFCFSFFSLSFLSFLNSFNLQCFFFTVCFFSNYVTHGVGEPVLNYLRPDRSVEDRHTIAEKGLEMAMKMIFLHDFVHGDLHPVRLVRTIY
jgi:hypothetical protein